MLCRGNLHQEYAVLAVKNLCARHQNVNVELQLASVGLDVGVQPLNAVTEEPLSKWMTRCKKKVASDLVLSSGTSETEKAVVTSQPAEVNNDCAPRRKPLSDIGNTLVRLIPISYCF